MNLFKLVIVVYAYNTSTQEAQEFKASLVLCETLLFPSKKKKEERKRRKEEKNPAYKFDPIIPIIRQKIFNSMEPVKLWYMYRLETCLTTKNYVDLPLLQ